MSVLLNPGADLIEFDALQSVITPPRTATHVPLPHYELVAMVKYALGYFQHDVEEEAHAITPDGQQYFGLLSLRSPYGDYSDTVGLRNSHDKSFPVGIAFGSKVMVCSNLAFLGDTVIKRRHTVHSKRDLPGIIASIVEPLKAQRLAQHDSFLRYKALSLSDAQADHVIMTLYRKQVLGLQRIGDVVREWENPSHDWGSKTCWRLFNAATFALAGKVAEKPDLTKQLHVTIDGICQEIQ